MTEGRSDDDRTLAQNTGEKDFAREQSLRLSGPPVQVPGVEPERFLGAGAYGEVWLASDLKTGRRVAVKFYAHRGGVDWTLLAREVEKLAFLFGNRHVVQLLDVGWESEPPYYVMEFMSRGSLEDRLKQGPIPASEALTLLRDVATGLIHAHGKGVLHCDLKPANVLIGDDGKPRLADFGQSRLTTDQQPALGTLFYMAPEQADLRAMPDARWDVYALGALFYCMLTGQPPHRTPETTPEIEQAGDLEHRLKAYRHLIRHAPRPRAHRDVPGVDRSLAEIIDRTLAADPQRRFPNIQAVVEALDDRARRLARRPLLVLGAVGPALLLLVMTWFAWAGYRAAIGQSEQTVVGRALESDRFAAQFVAETVARQIDHRWRVLEIEAGKPGFVALLQQATGEDRESAPRRKLQARLDQISARYRGLESTSWFIDSRSGGQLARHPLDEKTIDRNWAFRDYFHGQGHDFKPGTTGLKPIRHVHRSIVFTSRATGNRMVAFSVPIFASVSEGQTRAVIGILAMTVELGKFAELRPESRGSASQIAVLVDRRQDAQGRRGAVLEHPYLARLLRQGDTRLPAVYLDPEDERRVARLYPLKRHVEQLHEQLDHSTSSTTTDNRSSLVAGKPSGKTHGSSAQLARLEKLTRQLDEAASLSHYQDPVGRIDRGFQGRWLAAIDPVFIEGREESVRDVGWAVIIQERYETALQPVRHLGRRLVRQWLIAAGTVAGVITALWGVVMIILNEPRRSRVWSTLRRRVGLSTETTSNREYANTTTISSRNSP